MDMELVLGPLYEDDEHEYVVWQWAPAAPKGAAAMSADRDIAILGAGMHPWGKWGRNFVEYGVVAAQAALADAGVEWSDVQFVSGGETVRNGYPGYVAGATFAQALGWNGAQVASSYAACASGATALCRRARPDPRRLLRRRARDRRRHHAEGFPRTQQGRARRRSRLAALPPARRDQPHVLRSLRAPAHGAVRRDARRLRPGQGEERAPRPREPERALPQRGDRSTTCSPRRSCPIRSACSTSARPATARPRSSCAASTTRASTARATRYACARSRRSRRATRRPRIELPNFATDSAAGTGALPDARLQGVDRGARLRRRRASAPTTSTAPRSTTSRTAMELDWYEQIGLCAAGEAEKLLRDGETTIGGRVPVNPSGGLACFGEAVPAQAIAQVCELTWQIQGRADRPPGRGRQGRPHRSTKASSATAPPVIVSN